MCIDDMLSSESSTNRFRDTFPMLAALTSLLRKLSEERYPQCSDMVKLISHDFSHPIISNDLCTYTIDDLI